MSQANIPNITPMISISTEEIIPLLLASIALEELALAHIMNAEAEKIQFTLGTLKSKKHSFLHLLHYPISWLSMRVFKQPFKT